ncbi:uncharacterized protein E0L32_002947 [Thyridium curvatum]|uniref:U3 small nucleolar RNA-associated protein 6 N-terminal domain-containing protein n=1 Tax=Thyridium curvatum TaxID=1093900 RepID=A0A507BEU7_9PEZI|nr:uncharacterized protein E0L32_002947 [Thyridium curvatum]TPX17846.1 hypothetical protein E0L32_002947 [Thyridium curvatum]
MAGVAEKARFYLERAVPQLREFEEKEIFSKDEIRTLVQKRTEFEHLVLSAGNTPADFLSYVAWEQSLEDLRLKRCRRKKIKHSTSHAGQARAFQIFERAVGRHPGSELLWRRYLDHAARAGATKRWRKVMTRALRMHPTSAGLWVLAGRRAAADGDMEGARAMFMRGCRFCTRDEAVWVEYARAEMEWLARVGRKSRRAVALEAMPAKKLAEDVDEDGNMMFGGGGEDDSDEDDEFADGMALADGRGGGRKTKAPELSEEAVDKIKNSPALEGAIPRAVFDIARKQTFFKARTAEVFFDMFAAFTEVASQPQTVQHVLDAMQEAYPNDPSTGSCLVRQALIGVAPDTAAFPKALRDALAKLNTALGTTSDKAMLAAKTIAWIDPILAREDLDEGIRAVLEHTKRKLENS